MNCTVCKNGKLKKGTASKMFEKKGAIIVFKNVSAMICDNCGTKFFDGETSQHLLNKVRELRKQGTELEVINLKAA